ncbi:MAG TPA: putative baseplate assembly protein [Allosphingosinicella sp.]|nr:putative baseplate assembly protein [Allosphingosinicella sp.]
MDEITPCGGEDLDPVRPDNRSNLPQIAYRIGTQPEFLARMRWRIPRQLVFDSESQKDLKPLAALRARGTTDPTLALMDAFACSLDVLTFYSERVANEGYVGTALQRRSMIELARSIGYRLAPGVAASVQLAFTVEYADDPYRAVEVPSGVQAMSIPKAKGELPQIFETVEPILARAEWNAMPARTEQEQNLALYRRPGPADPDHPQLQNGRLYLFDLDNSFDADEISEPGLETIDSKATLADFYPVKQGLDLVAALDRLIVDQAYNSEIEARLRAVPVDEFYLRGVGHGLKPGQRMVAVGVKGDGGAGQVASSVLRVVSATEDMDYAMTIVVATPHGSAPAAVGRPPRYRAPRLPLLRMPEVRIAFNALNVDTMVRQASWTGESLSAVVRTQAWPRAKLMRLIRMPRFVEAPETSGARPGLYHMRDDAAFFGSTAPLWETLALPNETRGGTTKNPYTKSWDDGGPRTIWVDSQGVPLAEAHVFLDREIKEIVADGWAVLETPDRKVEVLRVAGAALQSRSDYALNGKVTGLTFDNPDGKPFGPPAETDESPFNAFEFRSARIFASSQALALSGTPIREEVAAGDLTIDLGSLYLDIERVGAVSISGNRSDGEGIVDSETLKITKVQHIGGHTRLTLEAGPEYSYLRPSVRINANMALATHGELFEELLGSGDASVPNQLFTLAKKPLTFVAADTPDGRASTLTIRVDGIEWHEASTLYDAGPYDRAYEVRLEDDGSTKVCFGDGVRGHRLPTGTSNILASYRTGIGFVGEVPDEAIIHLKTKPLGIRSVTNPTSAGGSGEAETLADARVRAPQSVRILGRIVSITDYQDFAMSFAGIGKARADMLWSGQAQAVCLTVAPESDSLIDDKALVLGRLRAAADQIRDGTDTVAILPYRRRYFQLAARLYKHPDHLADAVAAAARAALLAGFGYTARALAQPVSGAEAIALLQAIPGVVGVDLDVLALLDSGDPDQPAPDTLASVLPALPATILASAQGTVFVGAELLTILDSAISLTVENANA